VPSREAKDKKRVVAMNTPARVEKQRKAKKRKRERKNKGKEEEKDKILSCGYDPPIYALTLPLLLRTPVVR
jgi:hypothetical protein